MQIFLKSFDGRSHTLEVEGYTTYEDIVDMLTNSDRIDLLTTNPKIIIENRELKPGMTCADINVTRESDGHVVDRGPGTAIPRPPGPWVYDLELPRQLQYQKIRVSDEEKKKNEEIQKVIQQRDETVRALIQQRDGVIRERNKLNDKLKLCHQQQMKASRKKEHGAAQSRRRLNADLDLRGGYRKRSKTRKINRKGRRRKSSRR